MSDQPTTYLGIDPGTEGGMAWLRRHPKGAHVLLETLHMPSTDKDVLDALRGIQRRAPGRVIAAIEEQRPMPTRWVDRATGKPVSTVLASTCVLFGGYRALQMALLALSIPQEGVPPQRWQGGLGIPPKKEGEDKARWKRRLKTLAQHMHPAHHITNATADAVLIATWLMRKSEGRP